MKSIKSLLIVTLFASVLFMGSGCAVVTKRQMVENGQCRSDTSKEYRFGLLGDPRSALSNGQCETRIAPMCHPPVVTYSYSSGSPYPVYSSRIGVRHHYQYQTYRPLPRPGPVGYGKPPPVGYNPPTRIHPHPRPSPPSPPHRGR